MFIYVALLINLNQMYLNKHDSCKLIKGEEWSNSVICPSQVGFTSIKVFVSGWWKKPKYPQKSDLLGIELPTSSIILTSSRFKSGS